MNSQPSMVALVEEYLALRRGMGYALHIEGAELLRFARYADGKQHHGPITADLAIEWAKLPQQADPLYWARRLDIVRRFAKHRCLFDGRTEIPAQGVFGPSYRRPQPHIYSDEAIRSLIQQASLLGPAGGLRPKTYQTLFGLLACTGLRISEALHLKRDDVDIQRRLMTIAATKFKKTRVVPVHLSAARALERYSQLRDRYHKHPHSETFFLSERGTSLKYLKVLMTFIALRRQLGWEAKGQPVPTIHGLRHSFVVNRILQWYRQGVDIDRSIAALSTYLGHVKVTDTYWYMTATPKLLSLSTERFERFAKESPGGDI